MNIEDERSVKSNDDSSWLPKESFDDEEQVKVAKDHIRSPSEQVAELKSSDEKGTDLPQPVEEQIKALINQNKALINQNQVMNKQIEDIRKDFMTFCTHDAELRSSHCEDTDQRGVEENTENMSLVPNASKEPTHSDSEKPYPDDSESLFFAKISNETVLIEEPSLNEDQRNRRRTGLFRSFYLGEEINLDLDIYSVFIISRNWEGPFFFSLTVVISQFVIIILMLLDLLQNRRIIGEETLRIPPRIEPQVTVVQYLSLIIAFFTVDDTMISLKMLVIGYDPDIQIKSPGASYCKFLIANITRFFEGLCTILICLVIIVQSSEVLDLIMDFVAVSFVSQMDNIAFKMARDGFLGERLKRKSEKVVATKVQVQRSAFNRLINVLTLLIFCLFLAVLVSVTIMQMNGTLLRVHACENLDVRFGEEMLVFDDNVRFSFVGEGLNKKFANSNRTLPLLDETPTILPYQFFSGHYVAEKNSFDRLKLINDRPVYWETTQWGDMFKDPTSGKFYYCWSMRSWVFTIEALFDTPGVMANQTKEECELGWLMLSPPTEARILNDAPMEGWSIWTGSIKLSTPEFSISCADCRRDEDCGLTRGTCDFESRTCNCNDNWRGNRCQMKNPLCPGLVWVNEGESSREYFEQRPLFSILYLSGDHAHLYYDHPLYSSIPLWIVYAGRRWFMTYFEYETLSNQPHAYWDNNLATNSMKYSNPTTRHVPTGLTWNEIELPRSTGEFGPFGASFPVKGRFECIQVDCMNNRDVCGRYGTCVTRTEVVNGVEGSYNQCECSNYTGGYFCEHHPDQPYSRDMYNEYIVNPLSYLKHNPDLEYLKFWVNETRNADVDRSRGGSR